MKKQQTKRTRAATAAKSKGAAAKPTRAKVAGVKPTWAKVAGVKPTRAAWPEELPPGEEPNGWNAEQARRYSEAKDAERRAQSERDRGPSLDLSPEEYAARWDALNAALVHATVSKFEAITGNTIPPKSIPADLPCATAAAAYSGAFLFAARAILHAEEIDFESAEQSFREVATGRLRLSGEVAAAAAAFEDVWTGRFKTAGGWRNVEPRALPPDWDAAADSVRWIVLRWNLLEAVAGFYQECADAERAGVVRAAVRAAVDDIAPGTPYFDALRFPAEANRDGFLSPSWMLGGSLFDIQAVPGEASAWPVLEAFQNLLENLKDLRRVFRERIYTRSAEPDAPSADDALREALRAVCEAVHADGEKTRATVAEIGAPVAALVDERRNADADNDAVRETTKRDAFEAWANGFSFATPGGPEKRWASFVMFCGGEKGAAYRGVPGILKAEEFEHLCQNKMRNLRR